MATLKLIADEISDALNRPFDDMLKLRIKSIFRHELATIVHQQVNKYGIHDQFKSSFISIFRLTYDSNNIYSENDSTLWFKSINKIPKPVRYNTDDPFTYVGDPSGQLPYLYTKLSEFRYTQYLPSHQQLWQIPNNNTVKLPYRYFYQDDYIIINLDGNKDETSIPVLIEGLFIGTPNAIENGEVWNDNIEFPMPEDLIQVVKERLLKGELSIIDDKDKIKSEHIDNN
jgi:hypothetical protein